jgi:predicted nucleotidyltransferase
LPVRGQVCLRGTLLPEFPGGGPELSKADIGAPRERTPVKQTTKNNFTRQEILRALRRNDELLQKHAVRRIALFGSYATGRQNRKSDLDFLVDFERPTYDNFLGLAKDLERLFGRKVDILTPQGLESIRVKSIAESIRQTLSYV